jgi:predicted DCC family thiol-disulfide oxidoreductase YuxK
MQDHLQRVIFFAGVCGICNAWVNFILKRDRAGIFSFAPLQGNYAKEMEPEASKNLNTMIYHASGKRYYRTGAILRILRDLGGIWYLAWVFWFVPFFIRDFFYGLIARNRYRIFGKIENCRIPTPEEKVRFLD